MSERLGGKVVLGVSACVYGCKVRYNGRAMKYLEELGREKNNFIWTPVCPEVMAGLGVPRAAMRLGGGNGADFWEGRARIKNRYGQDISENIRVSCLSCLDTLEKAGADGYVFMEGSPTCGVYRTTLKDKRLGSPPGTFGHLLLEKGYFLIPAADLQSPLKKWDWLRRLYAFVYVKRADFSTKSRLYDVWGKMKFVCQELDRKSSDVLGHELAEYKGEIPEEKKEEYRRTIMDVLRKPTTPARIRNMLWKDYRHFVKKTGREIKEIKDPNSLRNMTTLARELALMERAAMEEGVLFGQSPVLRR